MRGRSWPTLVGTLDRPSNVHGGKQKIAAQTAAIVAEERSSQELRRAHKLTQKKMAEVLGIGQDSVSRLEQRSDLLISTLRNFVEAMGGKLSLVAISLTGSRSFSLALRPWSEDREGLRPASPTVVTDTRTASKGMERGPRRERCGSGARLPGRLSRHGTSNGRDTTQALMPPIPMESLPPSPCGASTDSSKTK